MSLRSKFALAGVTVVAFLGGVGAAWIATGRADTLSGVGPRYWRTTAGAGEASASSYQRAVLARVGIWALPQSEVVYFTNDRDDSGAHLDRNCDYVIAGKGDPRTRWWSISIYRDFLWIDNQLDRYSMSKTSVVRDPDGGYRIALSAHPKQLNWLPLGEKDGQLLLLFRNYQPHPSIARDPLHASLPTITRVKCG